MRLFSCLQKTNFDNVIPVEVLFSSLQLLECLFFVVVFFFFFASFYIDNQTLLECVEEMKDRCRCQNIPISISVTINILSGRLKECRGLYQSKLNS